MQKFSLEKKPLVPLYSKIDGYYSLKEREKVTKRGHEQG